MIIISDNNGYLYLMTCSIPSFTCDIDTSVCVVLLLLVEAMTGFKSPSLIVLINIEISS